MVIEFLWTISIIANILLYRKVMILQYAELITGPLTMINVKALQSAKDLAAKNPEINYKELLDIATKFVEYNWKIFYDEKVKLTTLIDLTKWKKEQIFPLTYSIQMLEFKEKIL